MGVINSEHIASGFFNAELSGGVPDRVYNAGDLTNYLKGLVTDGVLANPSTNLQVTAAASGLKVVIKEGKAFLGGLYLTLEADYELTLTAANTTLPRIDSITIKLNKTNRTLTLNYNVGVAASAPVAPSLTNTAQISEMRLANIRVDANATAITAAKITDTRLSAECGVVTGLIEQVDTDTIFDQYETALTDFLAMSDTAISNMTVFRQRSGMYTSSVANERVITIPSNLEYINNYDILFVIINGLVLKPSEYSVSGNAITLTTPLEVAGTTVEMRVLKNVNVTSTQEITQAITAVENEVDELNRVIYYCTGSNDNIAINGIVNAFYAGTGVFAGVGSDASLKLEVRGDIGVTPTSNKIFTWNRGTSDKHLTVDFSNCSRITISNLNSNLTCVECDVAWIEKMRLRVVATSYVVNGIVGNSITVKDCGIDLVGSSVLGVSGTGLIDGCKIVVKAGSGYGYAISNTGLMRVANCNLAAYRASGSTNNYIAGLTNNVTTSVTVCTGTLFTSEAVTGYAALYSYFINKGRYSITGDYKTVASNTTGGTGVVAGEIDVS